MLAETQQVAVIISLWLFSNVILNPPPPVRFVSKYNIFMDLCTYFIFVSYFTVCNTIKCFLHLILCTVCHSDYNLSRLLWESECVCVLRKKI